MTPLICRDSAKKGVFFLYAKKKEFVIFALFSLTNLGVFWVKIVKICENIISLTLCQHYDNFTDFGVFRVICKAICKAASQTSGAINKARIDICKACKAILRKLFNIEYT